MNLYLISQNKNNDYDSFDSAVVVSSNEELARQFHPNGHCFWGGDEWWHKDDNRSWGTDCTWTEPKNVTVELVGTALDDAKEGTVICASFNAKLLLLIQEYVQHERSPESQPIAQTPKTHQPNLNQPAVQ